jgi:hypothetical protein
MRLSSDQSDISVHCDFGERLLREGLSVNFYFMEAWQ